MGAMLERFAIDLSSPEFIQDVRYAHRVERLFPGLIDEAIASLPVLNHDLDWVDEAEVMTTLRRYRQAASLHYLWHDLNGTLDIVEVGSGLSQIARDCLAMALNHSQGLVEKTFGTLMGPDGEPVHLAVLGMGKLGGDELNFNSDIDVVMSYRCQGESTGGRSLDANQYLTRVARQMIRCLDQVTEYGKVWAVDTRLRPFGDAGSLVWSLPAIETYFVSEGRTWERYAWLKASHVAGDGSVSESVLEILAPFIYRRYLDYGIFESLRALHDKIDQQARLTGEGVDIKKGDGGIRALEFMVQSLQLLQGGREPSLRVAGFLPALKRLSERGLIDESSAHAMTEAYVFLRTLENRLQALMDQATHRLPSHPHDQQRLAWLMGFENFGRLEEALNHHRHWVRHAFQDRFHSTPTQPNALPWPPPPNLEHQLHEAGLAQHAQPLAAAFLGLEKRLARRPLSAEGRQRLEQFMPRLSEAVLAQPDPLLGLDDVFHLIDKIAQRSAYFALLNEHPALADRLLSVFRSSQRIAQWLIDSPQLLDDLIDATHQTQLPTPPSMDVQDPEPGLNALGRWKQTAFLRTALAELNGQMTAMEAGQALSETAETCMQVILEGIGHTQSIAVIAYGNLGARTLHYGSDLDCVFLHTEDYEAVEMARVAQRLITWMQLPLPGGRLFEIDTRLRPNGRAGLLVSHLTQFERYQTEEAWLWEHQALIRARWIAGDTRLHEPFEAIRAAVIQQPRSREETIRGLLDMRQKQKASRQESEIKATLNDIQFLAEALVLSQAQDQPELVPLRCVDEQLVTADGLPRLLSQSLVEAWQTLKRAEHHQWLDRHPAPIDPAMMTEWNGLITRAWQVLNN